jgi:surfeit locus 1 family protein
VTPLPVDTSGIPNDHLNYAITWFSLAALWMGMTLYLLWRIRRKPN